MRPEQRRGTTGFDGRLLESAMSARGWAPSDLARRAGVKVTAVSRYMRGERLPELATVERLAAALGCRPEELRTAASATLRDLREQAGASQEEAAAASGITRSSYGMIEQGRVKTMQDSVALGLADRFGVDRATVESAHAEAVARRSAGRPTRLVLEGAPLARFAEHLEVPVDDLLDLARRLTEEEGGNGR